MAEPSPHERLPLTLHLSPDIAKRLMSAAEAQKRPAADLAIDILDRCLPRVQPGEAKKGKIPYT